MNNRLEKMLALLSLVLVMAGLYMVFLYVPTEKTMGIVQRLFYLMVPVAWLAMLAFIIIFIMSIRYLRTRDSRWDVVAHSAAELGLLFTTLTLIVGMFWGKPVWGVWWTWEPRLTATLILWFIYIAYFIVRSFATEKGREAAFAATVGIIGFIDIPIIGMSTQLWRGMHPPLMIFEGGVAPEMLATLIVNILAFTALFVVLLRLRISLRHAESRIRAIRGAEESL